MKCITTALAGVLILEPTIFPDSRGYFFEGFQAERYRASGIDVNFVQDNYSRSKKNVLRGLHYQIEKPQAKLVFVTQGCVADVIVDIRPDSPTFKQYIIVELSDTNHRQVFIPAGYAHGFCVLSESADFVYKCSDYYHPAAEGGIIWNDPELQISWPVKEPILSVKDAAFPNLKF